jgi:hypothetical protein
MRIVNIDHDLGQMIFQIPATDGLAGVRRQLHRQNLPDLDDVRT